MKKTKFSIDVISDVYEGYTNGQRWNGWEMPYLSKAEVLRFLATEPFDEESATTFRWEGETLIETDRDEGCSDIVSTITIDGETYYRIGNGWVWEEVRIKPYSADDLIHELEMVKRAIEGMVVNETTGDIEYDKPMFMIDDITHKLNKGNITFNN